MSINQLANDWNQLKKKLETQFGQGIDLAIVLFLIGVQESGQGFREFNQTEKLHLVQIGTSCLLSQWGYFTKSETQENGFPVWIKNTTHPNLTKIQEDLLLKEASINYFKEINYFNI